MRFPSPWTFGKPGPRYRIVVALWLASFVTFAFSTAFGWGILGPYDRYATLVLGMIGYLLLIVFRPFTLPREWSVEIVDDAILTGDGRTPRRSLPVADLRRVVVATDGSGPWGEDFIVLLFVDDGDPVGVFPLEAAGSQDFMGWLAALPGFQPEAFAQAIGSTEIARFEIFTTGEDRSIRPTRPVAPGPASA